jgi:hypothetical protein
MGRLRLLGRRQPLPIGIPPAESPQPADRAAGCAVSIQTAAPIGVGLRTEFCQRPPQEDEWRTLVEALAPHSSFATAAWIRAWGNTFLPFQNWLPPLRYLTARTEEGRLRAVFPFATQRKFGISVASLAGFYWPFRVPIIPGEDALDVFDGLALRFAGSRSILALRYGPVCDMDAAVAGLNAALVRQGWRLHRSPLGATYAVELPCTWEQYEQSLGKKLRTNATYYERKMQREGALEILCKKGTIGAPWSETVRDLGLIEGQSWQQRTGGKARFFGEPNQSFWTSVLGASSCGSMASVWLMQFNGRPVSFCFCLDCGDTRHIVANHYAEDVRSYGTGSILYRHVFRDAVESGVIRRVNIGLGDSGYKSRWGAQPSFQLVNWIAFRPGARGRLLELAVKLH